MIVDCLLFALRLVSPVIAGHHTRWHISVSASVRGWDSMRKKHFGSAPGALHDIGAVSLEESISDPRFETSISTIIPW